jgi:hypothetical protein
MRASGSDASVAGPPPAEGSLAIVVLAAQHVEQTPVVQHPTAQSAVVPQDCPMTAAPLHAPPRQLFDAQSLGAPHGDPFGAPAKGMQVCDVHRPE